MLERGAIIGGDFEVLELIGRGGMGAVFLVHQRSTGAERALKVMLPEWQENAAFVQRFEFEAKARARIESEHVVEVIAHGVDAQRKLPFIAMELLRGQTLEERRFARGTPPKALALELLRQLFHGVAAAHDAKVVHRDLKPQNVFVAESRRADVPFTLKVLDFGIAKVLSSAGTSTEPLGTRAWMAPEQENTGADISASADVWSLGLLVFWLLTGRSFWQHANAPASLASYELQFAEMPRASTRALEYGFTALNPAFDAWFAQAVARAPEQRYANAGLAFRELLPLLTALPEWPGASTWLAGGASSEASDLQPTSARPVAESGPLPVRRSRANSPSRLYSVPQPSQAFVGRSQELRTLRDELARGDARVSVAVEGLPGIGKTELVLQLAQQLAIDGAFPGGIFWFAAESPDLLVAWASDAIGTALGTGGGSIRERAWNAVNAVSQSGLPTLVILDNVESWSEAERPGPLPLGVHVTLLITTRSRRLGGSRFRSVPLGFLKPSEASLLLGKIAGPDVDSQPGFATLLEHLQGHTLAIELAGTYLSEYPETSPLEYLDQLRAGKQPEAGAAPFTRYDHTVNDAFALLWGRFDERTRSLWQLAAQFAPDPATGALSDAVGLDAEARRVLRRYLLIDVDTEGSWRMHRLIRAFGAKAGDQGSQERASEAFMAGVVARAAKMELATGFRIYAPDRAHFDAAIRLARARPKAVRSCELFASIAASLQSIGELEAGRELLELAIVGDLENFGEAHENVATLRSNLANLLQDLGELTTARELLEAALASDLAHRSDNHFKILLRRSNLALLLQNSNETARGRELLQFALVEGLSALGEDDQMVAIARSVLSGILTELGELDAALELIHKSLASDLKRHGENHPYPSIRRFKLAAILDAQGDITGAISLLEMVMRSELAIRGPGHPRVALVRATLAALLHKTGDTARAEREVSEALTLVRGQPPRSLFRTSVEKLASKMR